VRRHLEHSKGFYFLQGRKKLVEKRLLSGKAAISKFKRVKRLAYWLRFVPYVRMVALTGSLAMKNGDAESDWDMLVVLRPGHIWTGRTLVTGFLHLIGKRRHGGKVRDRACLNYWITSESLEIVTKDLFSSNEYFFIVPLFGADEFGRFQLKNRWIRRFRCNYEPAGLSHVLQTEDSLPATIVRNVGEILLSDCFLEGRLASWQKKKIQANPKTHLPGSLIEATDKALIFLPKPQGPKVFEAFKEKMGELESAAR
jgi:predicted nucleotidyltransferase